jgi:protein gp37
MGKDSSIEWTKHTFNPWRGCTKVSEGCRHCYAEVQSKRNLKVLGEWGPSGTRVVASESMWREPLKWDRAAREMGERHRVFCASLADVFEDWSGPLLNASGERLFKCCQCSHSWSADMADYDPTKRDRRPICQACGSPGPNEMSMPDVRDRLFDLIRETEHLDWLLLTKRPQNIAAALDRQMTRHPFIVHDSAAGPRCERWTTWKEIGTSPAKMWPNVWLGTSVENQQTADERIPHLLKVPAAVRFLSCEPLLGEVSLTDRPWWDHRSEHAFYKAAFPGARPPIDWVIVGGESGPGARPMDEGWARSIRNQCDGAGVAFFMKQMGGARDKRGDLEAIPEDLRVREFPDPRR